MDISEQLIELNSIKASIRAAIEAKGVVIPAGASFASFADYIDEIPTGGGGGGNIIKEDVTRVIATELVPPSITIGDVNRDLRETVSFEEYKEWQIHGNIHIVTAQEAQLAGLYEGWALMDEYIENNYVYNALKTQVDTNEDVTLTMNIQTTQVWEQQTRTQALIGTQYGDNKFAIGLDGINGRFVLVDKRGGYSESSCTTYGTSGLVHANESLTVTIRFNNGTVTLSYQTYTPPNALIGAMNRETIQCTMSNPCILKLGGAYSGDSQWAGFAGYIDIDNITLT